MFLPLAPARRGDFGAMFDCGIYLGCRSFDGQAYIGTPSGVIRCRAVRQLSAQERCEREFVLIIQGTPWSPDGSVPEMSTSVWISLRLEVTEVRIRQILTHQSSPRECASLGRCSRGLVYVWVAATFERELGTRQTTLSDVAKGLSRSLRRSLKEPSRVARDRERIQRARNEEPGQRPDREVIEGSGASSSRDGAGRRHVQLNRVSVLVSLRENKAMMQTWAILRVTGGDPESRSGRKEKQRGSGSMSLMVKKAMNGVETEEEWVRIHRRPRRDLFSPHDSQGGPKLSDMSKRRESTVCSTDGVRTEVR